ncbi:winged helix-turn-helix domain-containing protein [Novosphingobium aquimarinum]|uniref:winged helix-turn-helix domain-containing protein n=1 Tax=Novosphingobium aquimarinum TaxID=2682494 RepID=UPI0012EBD64F|nr:LysR family transcriptional regulator [Novosphingobium aquimarinum]
MTRAHSACKIKVQILCDDEIAMGPGKADLLEAFAREGSISAAGRALGMSYRRTWLLVDTMNRCWHSPLVETVQGGRKGGGARLTDLGTAILAQYRQLQADLDQASGGAALHALTATLRERPAPAQSPRSPAKH